MGAQAHVDVEIAVVEVFDVNVNGGIDAVEVFDGHGNADIEEGFDIQKVFDVYLVVKFILVQSWLAFYEISP